MMMEKSKPSANESPVVEEEIQSTTTNGREAEITRRLAALGNVNLEEQKAEVSEPSQEDPVDEQVQEPTIVNEPIEAISPPLEEPKEEEAVKKPEPTVPLPAPPAQTISAKANNKSALLVSTILHCIALQTYTVYRIYCLQNIVLETIYHILLVRFASCI
jgi:hypothetical protein